MKPKGLGIRYSEIDIQKRVEIYNFTIEKAKEMISKNELNYHELSRIILRNYGVYLYPVTVREWVIGKKHPLRNPQLNPITKTLRRPPDSQIIPTTLGLLYSDLHFHTVSNTLVFSTTTTYEGFARSIATLYSKYGHTSVTPVLCRNEPEWRLSIYLDRSSWNQILMTPIFSMGEKGIKTFLAHVIDGDGWLALHYKKKKPTFIIAVSSSYTDKAKLLSELFEMLGYHVTVIKRAPRTHNIGINDRSINQKKWENTIILYRRRDVFDFLSNIKFLHPMKEAKRIWILKINKLGLDIETSKKIWRYLHQAEKSAKLYSKLKAALLLSKRYDISDTINELKGKYIESARLLEQLRPTIL
jgi:hypothetical protein